MIDLKFSVHELFTHVVHICTQYGYVNQDEAMIQQTTPSSERIKQSLIENYFDGDTAEYQHAELMVEWLTDKSASGTSEFMDVSTTFCCER